MSFEEWFEDRYGSQPDIEHDSYVHKWRVQLGKPLVKTFVLGICN